MAPLGNRARNEIIRDGFAAGVIGRKSRSAKKHREFDGVQHTERQNFMDMTRRFEECFVIGERARRGEIARVGKIVLNPSADRGGLPKRESRADPRGPKQSAEMG